MIIKQFTVTICTDELPPRQSKLRSPSIVRGFRFEELEKNQTQIIDMDTVENKRLVFAIRAYLHHVMERDGKRLYRSVCEPNRLHVRRVM